MPARHTAIFAMPDIFADARRARAMPLPLSRKMLPPCLDAFDIISPISFAAIADIFRRHIAAAELSRPAADAFH